MDNQAQMAAYFAAVSRDLLARSEEELTFQRIADRAVDVIPPCDFVGITLRRKRGRPASVAVTDPTAQHCDDWQYELDEGPCLTAWRTGELVRVDDTATDARWPRWNEAASRLGVRSVLSTPLLAADESIGAMKVYCERPMNYGAHDEHVMRLLAAQAAILLANSQSLAEARRLSRQLTAALTSRDAIAQATGVLLGQGLPSGENAFAALAAAARRANRPIEDVANALLRAVTARNSRSTSGAAPRP